MIIVYQLGKVEIRQGLRIYPKMSSNIERLIVPKFRDVPGHWAEEYIEKLYSLDVFDDKSMTFFVPEGPITRKEYIVAVMKASDIEPEIPVKRIDEKLQRKYPHLVMYP